MNDPLAVRCLPGDDPDVMPPNHHDANARAACIHALVRPGARQRETAVRFAEIFTEIAAAPGPMTMMAVLRARICLGGKDEQDNRGRSTNAGGWREGTNRRQQRSERVVPA